VRRPKVLLGQDDKIGDELSAVLVADAEAERIVTDWATAARGRALWLVGSTWRKSRPSAPRSTSR